MKIAYITHAYCQPMHCARMLDALWHRESDFFVHIDRRVDIKLFEYYFNKLDKRINISLVKREKSYWGSINCVIMILNALHESVNSEKKYDFFYFMSGQDYPIKSNNYIHDFLSSNPNTDFINHSKLQKGGPGTDRYERTHILISRGKILRRLIKLFSYLRPKKHPPFGYSLYSGEFYIGLSRNSAIYILNFINKHPEYLNYFRYSYIPEEAFFQTLLCNRNSNFPVQIVNSSLTYVSRARQIKASPTTLLIEDFDNLVSSDCLFARKFDERLSAELLDALDEMRISDC